MWNGRVLGKLNLATAAGASGLWNLKEQQLFQKNESWPGEILPVTSNLQLWLDSSDSSTVILTDNAVSSWNDKSGNSRNATQATSANRPTYVQSAIGGKPAIRFDGANDHLTSTFSFLNGNTTHTIFIVMKYVGNGSSNDGYKPTIGLFNSGGSDKGAIHYINPSAQGASYPYFPAFNSYDNVSSYTIGSSYIIEFSAESTVWRVLRNGIQEGTANVSTSPSGIDGIQIARQPNPQRHAQNDYAEILIYNVALSAGDKTLVRNYLNSKWAVY
jgi:hypothetical protein